VQPKSSTRQLAETVDIFPTLAQLAGLPAPEGPQSIDGKGLVPVLKNPSVRVRNHAFHAYPKSKLGRAIRTERFRLVQWKKPDEDESKAVYELYDYAVDSIERQNVVDQFPEVVAEMKSILATYPKPKARRPRRK
ncbi:MAG: sulfatase/phosphatase domain-containing protein, partial [Planctomycetaceae bacterium]